MIGKMSKDVVELLKSYIDDDSLKSFHEKVDKKDINEYDVFKCMIKREMVQGNTTYMKNIHSDVFVLDKDQYDKMDDKLKEYVYVSSDKQNVLIICNTLIHEIEYAHECNIKYYIKRNNIGYWEIIYGWAHWKDKNE